MQTYLYSGDHIFWVLEIGLWRSEGHKRSGIYEQNEEIACCRRLDDRGTSCVHRKRQTSNKTVDRTPRTVNKVNYDRYQ